MVLKVLLLLFVIFYLLILYFKKKYYNPYTSTFIFGKKGSGKTCYMVHEMVKYYKRGWTIYTDIPVNIPYIRHIENPNELFKTFTPEPHSVIFLDEVGITWHSRNYKTFDARIREWLKLQRHYHVRIYMASQDWDVDKSVRQLNDYMILQTNIGNFISISRPITRKVTLTEATSEGESRIADQLQFMSILNWRIYIMPKYFRYFNSYEAPERPLMPYTNTSIQSQNLTYKQLRKQGYSRGLSRAILKQYSLTHVQ